jgi:voltage-gated sodium channel
LVLVGEIGQLPRRRKQVAQWVESAAVQWFVVALIVINAITLGLQTSKFVSAIAGDWLLAIDAVILTVFAVEIVLKLYAYRWRFFTNGWNVFDFLIVGFALLPASGPLAILRAMRILRVLRLVSMVPSLRFVVESLLRAIPGITSIAVLMLLIFYVFAVMATGLFGDAYPGWFGSVGASMYSLFQVMTLESWSMGIVRPVMETHPMAWLFFVPFILITTFTVLNLFIAIIVNTMQNLHETVHDREQDAIANVIHNEVLTLRDEIRSLRHELQARAKETG